MKKKPTINLGKCCRITAIFYLTAGMILHPLYGKPAVHNSLPPEEVHGTVKDITGEPLPGVTVLLKGTNIGTVTDAEGFYRIDLPDEQEGIILVFSYVGYKSQEIPLDNRAVIDVVLEENLQLLDEVIVVGYGTMEKSDFTGSSSTAKIDHVEESQVISVPEALQGRLAGVQIINNTGEPGAGMTFNIRGMTSVTGSNQPLIVVDGQPIESGFGATMAGMAVDGGLDIAPVDPLASINPSDIESIEVLKDASSIAIYGSRGANGVVLITTKSGKAGRDRVTYSTRFDVSMLPKQLPVLNSLDFANFKNEAALNDGKDSVYTAHQIDSISQVINVNWQDEVYKTAISQTHQLSFSGGGEKTSYLITGNYADQNSIINNAAFTRYGLRANISRNVSKKLKVGLRTYFSYADREYGKQSNWTGIAGSSAVLGALAFNPLRMAYTEDDVLDETFANNPLLVTTLVKDNTQIRALISNLTVDYEITKHLTYQLKAGVNDMYSLRQVYYPTGTFIGNTAPNGSATRADNGNSNYLIDNLLTYKQAFKKKHRVNAVAGFSYQQWHSRASSVTNMNFPSNALQDFNFQSATSPGRMYTNYKSRALQSVLARANYVFDRRYLITVTGRYDGATRLAPGKKWQLFPSVGLGWNVFNENFFKEHVKFVNYLKLRASYGIAGNENIAIGATQATYGINYGVFGNEIQPGYVVGDFENPNLKWETTTQLNVGADLGFLEDRITLSLDLYEKNTTDLLINLALPASSGYSNYFTNIGEVVNRGIDIEGTFSVLDGGVKWDAGANFSIFDNEVIDMGPLDAIYGRGYIAAGAYVLSQPLHVAKPGHPISSFWGYKTAGIYQNAEEIAAGPETATAQPGDIKYVDVSGDGKITDEDKTIIGKPNADFTYGFSSNLSYKRLTFSFNIYGSYGNELINLNQWILGANNSNGNFNIFQEAYDNRWKGEGTSNKYPRATTNRTRLSQRFPDWMVEDASFVRLQSVTLGYSFDLPKLTGGSVKVFVSGTNLYTLTKYSGYDPNINAFGHNSLSNGLDFGTLPQPRTYSAGLEITF